MKIAATYGFTEASEIATEYECVCCPSSNDLEIKLAERLPDAVNMDMNLAEGKMAGVVTLKQKNITWSQKIASVASRIK